VSGSGITPRKGAGGTACWRLVSNCLVPAGFTELAARERQCSDLCSVKVVAGLGYAPRCLDWDWLACGREEQIKMVAGPHNHK
jgi:hypothetical protein